MFVHLSLLLQICRLYFQEKQPYTDFSVIYKEYEGCVIALRWDPTVTAPCISTCPRQIAEHSSTLVQASHISQFLLFYFCFLEFPSSVSWHCWIIKSLSSNYLVFSFHFTAVFQLRHETKLLWWALCNKDVYLQKKDLSFPYFKDLFEMFSSEHSGCTICLLRFRRVCRVMVA